MFERDQTIHDPCSFLLLLHLSHLHGTKTSPELSSSHSLFLSRATLHRLPPYCDASTRDQVPSEPVRVACLYSCPFTLPCKDSFISLAQIFSLSFRHSRSFSPSNLNIPPLTPPDCRPPINTSTCSTYYLQPNSRAFGISSTGSKESRRPSRRSALSPRPSPSFCLCFSSCQRRTTCRTRQGINRPIPSTLTSDTAS